MQNARNLNVKKMYDCQKNVSNEQMVNLCVYAICDEQGAAMLQNEKLKLFNNTQLSCWSANHSHKNFYYKKQSKWLVFCNICFFWEETDDCPVCRKSKPVMASHSDVEKA